MTRSQTGFLIFLHPMIIPKRSHADKQLCLCSLFLNLQNQHDSLALFSGLTQHLPQFAESHHTSHLQIQLKLFAVTPQEKQAHHSHSAFQQTSSCSSPSCYTHKTNGDRSFFSLTFKSLCCIALIYTTELCLNSLSTCQILSHRQSDRQVENISGLRSVESSNIASRNPVFAALSWISLL